MKKLRMKTGAAFLLCLAMAAQMPAGVMGTGIRAYADTARSANVNADNLNVRSGPGTNYPSVAKLGRGTAVTVTEETAAGGRTWYKIRFQGAGGAETTGYAAGEYIRFPVVYNTDHDFEQYLNQQGFPDSYKDGLRQLHAQYPQWVFTAQHTGLDWNTVIQNEGVIGRNLVHKSSISSWKSIADGAFDWDNNSWPGFDGGSWVAASEGILSHYMDPRNFLDEVSVFQFLLQSFDASDHTADGLRLMVKGSFLENGPSGGFGGNSPSGNQTVQDPGNSPAGGSAESGSQQGSGGPGVTITPVDPAGEAASSGSGGNAGGAPVSGGNPGVDFSSPQASVSRHMADRVASSIGPGVAPAPSGGDSGSGGSSGGASYVDILMEAGRQSGVNPYVLAAMIIQEQGSAGSSGSISGTTSGYEGYYNFFNIEAYQSGGMSAVQRGLWYASQSGSYNRPWNSAYKSIMGGAEFYGANYVKVGQDTFYLKKFNVQGSNLYKHQYMTNVQGAASEASKLAQAYSKDMKQTALKFKIPVYQNMPQTPCQRPAGDGSPNNKLRMLGVDGFTLTPSFSKDTLSYDLVVDSSVSQITVQAQAIDPDASVGGTGAVFLQDGANEIKVTVQAPNGTAREYSIHVARQGSGQTPSNGGQPGGAPAQDSVVAIPPA